MNRYEIYGIGYDLAAGKRVCVLAPAAEHLPAAQRIANLFLDDDVPNAKLISVNYRVALHTDVGGQLEFHAAVLYLRGKAFDVILDKLQLDPWGLIALSVRDGGEYLR